MAAILVASMNLQLEMVNESYYKQILAIALVLAMVYGLDKIIYDRDERYTVPTILMAGATYYYHYATAFTTFIFLGLVIFAFVIFKNKWAYKKMGVIVGGAFVAMMPALIPQLNQNINTILGAVNASFLRAGMIVLKIGRAHV